MDNLIGEIPQHANSEKWRGSMRIGLIDLAGDPGGARTYARAIAESLRTSSGANYELTFFVRSGTDFDHIPSDYSVVRFDKHPRKRGKTPYFSRKTVNNPTGIQESLESHNIDLAWCLAPNRAISQITRTPYVLSIWDLAHIHLNGLPEFPSGYDWHARDEERKFQVRRAIHVFTESTSTGKALQENYGLASDSWTSLGLPLREVTFPERNVVDTLRSKYGTFFLYPASFWAHKNHRVLVEAMSYLTGNVRLVFTGGDRGHLQEIQRQIVASGFSERISYLGRVSDAEIDALIVASVGVLMPSIAGPTNYPPLEAWALGKPAIISNVHSFDSLPHEGAYFASAHDPRKWAEIMNSIAASEESPEPWSAQFPRDKLMASLDEIALRLSLKPGDK